jgi:hypothetical protein
MIVLTRHVSAIILFSTFGVSLSFGVLEDHYTVSIAPAPNGLTQIIFSGFFSTRVHLPTLHGSGRCNFFWISVLGCPQVCIISRFGSTLDNPQENYSMTGTSVF